MHHRTELYIAFRDQKPHRCVGALIRFLDRDVYRHGSGYANEAAWHLLKSSVLTSSQRRQLQEIALRYLHKRMTREFWYMCRFICRHADDAFRARVDRLADSKDRLVQKRASLLRAYLESPAAGEEAHREFKYECLRTKRYVWRPLSFYQARCVE
jgi:hypothetical protein